MHFLLIVVVVLLVAVLLVRADKKIVRSLRRAGATSREKAVPFRTNNLLYRWRIRRLISAGVIDERKNGRLCLCPGEWENFTRRRRKRVLVAVALAAAAALASFLITRFV